MSFAEILEVVEDMDISEREMLIDIVRKRLGEQKRKNIQTDVRLGRKDYSKNNVTRGSSKDLLAELGK